MVNLSENQSQNQNQEYPQAVHWVDRSTRPGNPQTWQVV